MKVDAVKNLFFFFDNLSEDSFVQKNITKRPFDLQHVTEVKQIMENGVEKCQ